MLPAVTKNTEVWILSILSKQCLPPATSALLSFPGDFLKPSIHEGGQKAEVSAQQRNRLRLPELGQGQETKEKKQRGRGRKEAAGDLAAASLSHPHTGLSVGSSGPRIPTWEPNIASWLGRWTLEPGCLGLNSGSVCPWERYLTSLCLNVFICKTGIIRVPRVSK